MSWRLLVASAPFALLVAACAPEHASPPDPHVLMAADSAFDADVARGGSEAWASWFASDGALVREGVGEIRGRADVRAAVAALDRPGVSLRWSPARAEISASGDLGWTTGSYVFEAPGPDGEIERDEGIYVSIWRREDDGPWQVVMDLGHSTTPVEDPTESEG